MVLWGVPAIGRRRGGGCSIFKIQDGAKSRAGVSLGMVLGLLHLPGRTWRRFGPASYQIARKMREGVKVEGARSISPTPPKDMEQPCGCCSSPRPDCVLHLPCLKMEQDGADGANRVDPPLMWWVPRVRVRLSRGCFPISPGCPLGPCGGYPWSEFRLASPLRCIPRRSGELCAADMWAPHWGSVP